MLQQTRVAATIPYFERFLARFPDVEALANAPESDLLACWAGLGYYRRARNLQKAAQLICERGSLPETYAEIRQLPGIGSYTAAAIASIGFGLPHAVVDGNVYRVLSRVFADPFNIAAASARAHFSELAEDLLDRGAPGRFNQALMELGATLCLPKNPQCLLCPVANWCEAKQQSRQNEFPVKIAPRKSVEETRTVFWIERDGRLLLWRRPADSRLMPGFWELPEPMHLPEVEPGAILGTFRHGITFHNYTFRVVEARVPANPGGCEWRAIEDFRTVPVSTIVRKAIRIAGRKARAASG